MAEEKTAAEVQQIEVKRSDACGMYQLVKREKKVEIAIGHSIVSDKFDTFEDAEAYIASKPYELIFTSMQALLDMRKK